MSYSTGSKASREGCCLYCLEPDKPPSIEHVTPLGLGPHLADLLLPQGAVCEPCNNYLGREVDEGLVHLLEVQLIRGIFRIPNRRGKTLDELPLGNGRIVFTTNAEVMRIEVSGEGHIHEKNDGKNLLVNVVGNRKGSGAQLRRATRAILKAGLNLLYLKRGANVALDPFFDPARKAITGDAYTGFLLIGAFDPLRWPNLSLSLLFDSPGMGIAVRFQYGGLDLLVDLTLGAPSEAVRGWAHQNDYRVMEISPLAQLPKAAA